MEELVTSNMGLVYHVANKFRGNRSVELEDVISTGMIGLIKAVRAYNPDKGASLATFAIQCITNEILMFLKREKRMAKLMAVSLDTPIVGDESLTLVDTLSVEDDTSSVIALDIAVRLDLLIAKMHGRNRRIMELKLAGLKQRSIAKHPDVQLSQSYVSRILKQTYSRLQKVL